jgi:Uma2 family endonuclease
MTTALAAPQKLLTAEDYLHIPDDGRRTELRRGVVVYMNPPGFRHGAVCSNIHHLVDGFVRAHQLGRTLINDSDIITERDPDTVRGADISFYSHQRVPKNQMPIGYAGASPEIVFEVVSPTNTRRGIAEKIGEYVKAGVNVVCVVDPQHQTVNLYFPDLPTEKLQGDDLLTFAELPGFSVGVKRLFE